eukprot:5832754-Karenia_brevis.AAC.1
MTLPSSSASKINDGDFLIEVDDILEGGSTARHRKNFEGFYRRWTCGKRKKLRDKGEEEGTLISGVRDIQHKDFSLTWHMEAYVGEKLALIETPR